MTKKLFLRNLFSTCYAKKLLLIMKLTTFFLILVTLQLSASGYSQDASLKVNFQSGTLADLIEAIETQSDFRIFYKTSQVNVRTEVSLAETEGTVASLLSDALEGSSISYQVLDRLIVLVNTDDTRQELKISGTVTDDATGEPMAGVNIQIEGTLQGAITDVNGKYTIDVPSPTSVLIFSFVGYNSQQVNVQGQSVIDVSLTQNIQSLEEVVVIGYGVQKKKLTTGATVQVKGDEIQKMNTTNTMTALQGVTPGVQITKSSGQPGEGFNVRVRGLGTTGDAKPLYIVDGLPMGNIDYLSPSDIESVDVLKDAASAAIYGSRAANGVVLVTTKQGKKGQAVVSYDGYYGIQNLYKTAPMLTAQEYAVIMNEGRINSQQEPYDFASVVPNWDDIEAGRWNGTNWLKEITVKNAPIQSHSLNITGGTERSIYSVGLAYTSQDGILGKPVASKYDRYNFRANTEHELFKKEDRSIIKIGETLTYSYNEKSGIAIGNIYWNDVHNMLVASPFLPVYDENGDYHKQIDWNSQEANPIGIMDFTRGHNKSKNHQLTGAVYMEVQPIRNLKWRTSYGINMSSGTYRSFTPSYDLSLSAHNTDNVVSQSMYVGMNWTFENTLTYNFNLLDVHNISVMAGTTAERGGLGESMSGSNVNSIFNDFDHGYLDNTKLIVVGKTTLEGNPWGKSGLLSYFGRFNYDFKEKYMLTAIMRADASSNFAKGKRWGYFPSVSAGWLVSSESFMSGVTSYMDFLKLRASWGQNGNQSINPFQYLATIDFTGVNYFFGTDKSAASTGAYPDILPNPDVTWETSEQTDIGFDARFLNGSLSLSFDWYNKVTKDWLIDAPILLSYGTNAPYINGGDVRNRGIEIVAGYRGKVGGFNYYLNANIATNKNEVIKIANSEGIIHGLDNVLSQGTSEFYRAEVGYPIGYFYGYKTNGIFQNEAEVQAYVTDDGELILPDAVPGDVRFVDVDKNGTIDVNDKTMIGDPNPNYTYGISFGGDFKGFDISVMTTGVGGNQIAKSYRSFADSPQQNYTTEILGRWHGEGTSNKLPRLTSGAHINTQYVSDIFIEDGDYFRISNITIGYDFKKLFKNIPLTQTRIYFAVQNLYTFTKYSGMDPEIGYSPDSDGKLRFSSGIDLGYYPSPRTMMVGASIKF